MKKFNSVFDGKKIVMNFLMKEKRSIKALFSKIAGKSKVPEIIIQNEIPAVISEPVDIDLLNEIQYIPGGIDDYLYNYLVIGNILPYMAIKNEKRINTTNLEESRITA